MSSNDLANSSYEDLLARKETIRSRMAQLSSKGNDDVQVLPGSTEVHWDNVMKEMRWLADDFQKERQRHIGNAKKLTKAVDTFHGTKEARKLKKSKDETIALKKISSKVSRDVRKFWLKINKVVAFKQKIDADEVRQKAMDKHLVFLVKQTERYTNMLAENMVASFEDAEDENEDQAQENRRGNTSRNVSRSNSVASLSESVLTSGTSVERVAKRKASQSPNSSTGSNGELAAKRMRSLGDDSGDEAGGSNNPSDSENDDVDFEPEDEQDDETTLLEEEEARARERAKRRATAADGEVDAAGSDEEELAMLKAEGEMDIEQLKAMYANMPAYDSEEEEQEESSDGEEVVRSTSDKMAEPSRPNTLSSSSSKNRQDSSESEDEDADFEPDDEQDDETTLIEEEQARARERARRAEANVSASTSVEEVTSDQEELALLQAEGEMDIEQLKAMYANMPAYDSEEEEEEEESDGEDRESEASDDDAVPTAARRVASVLPPSAKVTSSRHAHSGDAEVIDQTESAVLAEDEGEDEDVDFEPEDEQDDETTLIEEEQTRARERAKRRGAAGEGENDTAGSDDEELAMLKAEGEMDIEQLRAMYANMPAYDSEGDGSEEDGDNDAESDADTVKAVQSTVNNNSKAPNGQSAAPAAAPTSEDEGEDEDVDFEPEDEQDDETTLIEEEQARARERAKRRGTAADGEGEADAVSSDDEELAMLKAEGEMDIEQLRAMYANMPAYDSEEDEAEEETDSVEEESRQAKDKHVNVTPKAVDDDSAEEEDDEDEDVDFEPEDEQDDETTLLEEEEARARERAKRRATAADGEADNAGSDEEELAMLKAEGEMDIEQLRAMYANMPAYDSEEEDGDGSEEGEGDFEEVSSARKVTFETARRSGRSGSSRDHTDDTVDESTAMEVEKDEEEPYGESSACLESKDNSGDNDDNHDTAHKQDAEEYDVDDAMHRLEAADLAARSIRVDRPFVLSKKVTLREYQHIGLNWLVSLHERRLNGILADEMGLGKTLQTISLLAYLAIHKGIWGPHLIIVPTSCIVNWETELKKFCPIFKVLTYFGSAKKRKFLRSGWSKLNSFHICITSYQIVVQDSNAFRRKRWYYMILDEAHNIKNFKSKRWQTLLNYNTQRRLLLTGTPLQNNLMELWSLMHFLMPHIFRSRKEFSYWFSNPLSGMVEGNRGVNNDLIGRLHSIMRPFLLRRLKKDVAKQLPGKFEHIVMCRLSKRQLHLYEEYMSRSATRSSLTGGNFLGMMNILMQLRKVCNHPDLFEPRPISSPFAPTAVTYRSPALVVRALDRGPLCGISPAILEFWSFDRDPLATQLLKDLQVPREQFVQVEDVSLEGSRVSNKPQIKAFADNLRQVLQMQVQARQCFNYEIMSERCTKPNLPYSWRLVRAVSMVSFTTQVMMARHCPRARRDVSPAWFDLIKSVDDRVQQTTDMVAHFVFVLPKVVTPGVQIVSPGCKLSWQDQMLSKYGTEWQKTRAFMRQTLAPFYPALMRQRIFFPDRKLIQFDSGKLQTLAVLLRDLKKGGHKCLIFTQMSKMLDILEIFLNLHDHSFVRLDGSTSIDRRQKLMDRFNSDPKLFVFILSTRSGGLGINLTGADTVIFYDTDWNPAMDAQAQDRAHRIGQTRDVHIYRLVSESTVEENILTKAKQKRHLDFLVMTEGNFSEASLFSAKGMKDILGVDNTGVTSDAVEELADIDNANSADIEAAMAAAEDEEDVKAMKAAALEATKDADEFDEAGVVEPGLDDDDAAGGATNEAGASASTAVVIAEDPGAEEKDMEKEFASWQASLGPDFKALESALKPIERYALKIRTEVEPYYSIFYITEQARLEALNMSNGEGETWNVEEIEREKEEEEMKALQDGELLATNVTQRDIRRHRSWFLQERARRVSARRMRTMTGAAWSIQTEEGVPFWYNSDTGQAMYQTPAIILEQEKLQWARERGYNAMPLNIMLHIFSYLLPFPERCAVAPLCARWAEAANHASFRKRVLPVETGARDPTKRLTKLGPNVYASIEEALQDSLPGDTIELGMGHHWEGSLLIDKPTRVLCESGGGDDCSKCVIELTGQVQITSTARAAVFFGITVRRPRKVYKATSCILAKQSSLSIFNCVINNDGAKGSAVCVISAPWLRIGNSRVLCGTAGVHAFESSVLITDSLISENTQSGLVLVDSECCVEDTFITKNTQFAVQCVAGGELVVLRHCDLRTARPGGSLFSVVAFDPPEEGKNIYTQLCVTDAANEEELRMFPWHTAPSPRGKGSLSKNASRSSFDDTRVPSQWTPDLDEFAADCDYFEEYTIPQGAAVASKKRVRV